MKKTTQDDFAEMYSVFGDMQDQTFMHWGEKNKSGVEGLDISDIPPGDLHSLAERIREWKKKQIN